MMTTQLDLERASNPPLETPLSPDSQPRNAFPHERVLGLSLGTLYRLTDAETTDTSSDKLAFVRAIDRLDTWNETGTRNSAQDLFVTLHLTSIEGVTSLLRIKTAGNVYDENDPNVDVLRLNGSLLKRTHCIAELFDTTAWSAQPPHIITPLEAVSPVADILQYHCRKPLTPY